MFFTTKPKKKIKKLKKKEVTKYKMTGDIFALIDQRSSLTT